ncbi:hypothetical protein AeMF1_002040 [Aphanomyces euteiches]|nr:hypothetical protein AeMF1_002040 [Aphanomyces euteiches]
MVINCTTAADMMKLLRERYGNKSFVGHGRLIDKVTHMHMKPNETPRTYCDRFKLAIDGAHNSGVKFADEHNIHFFLNGLDTRFTTFVQLQTHVLQRCSIDASTLSSISTELIQTYTRVQPRSTGTPPTLADEVALAAHATNHVSHVETRLLNLATPMALCQRDQRQQSTSQPNQRRVRFQASPTTSQLSATAANTRRNARSSVSMLTLGPHCTLNASESPASSSAWILDSGASDHFCNDAAWYEDLQPFEGTVRAANGSDMPIAGTGSVVLEMNTPTGVIPVTLQDVLFTPNLQYNLFSLSRVTDRGFSSQFQRNTCSIIRNKVVYAQGFKQDNLYYLDIANPLPTELTSNANIGLSMLTISTTPLPADLWHARLGHISVKYTAKTCQYTDGIELDDCKHEFCESCLAGKQSRLPFPKRSLSTTSEPFVLVHSDICGPMRHPALRDRSRYFITFTYDYSRYGFVFFLKNKSDALQCFKEFTAYCRTQFDLPVRCLHSDNGGEYFSNSFSEFLLENGIQHDATVPHTPQQNGVNERMNRTLVECARSMLHFCKAPLRFWAEAVSHAMYLRNRTYSSSTPGMTPFERLWKSKPDLGNLRIFGCEAYAHVEPHQRSKFASKTIRAMYLGHEPNIKGYRLYTSRPERTIISRNVVFNETKSFFTGEPADDESPVSQLLDEIDDDDDDELFPLQLMNLRSFQDVPRRSTRIRRGNSRYNVPPVYVPPPASVGSSTPPITQVERTTPILADNPSMPCVENPPQPSDASTTSRVEPVQQQFSAESPADIPLPSSPPQAPMSRMDAPVVIPEFVPIMISSTAPTSFSSFDEDALCEQSESMALSVYSIFCPDDANSDVDEQQLNKQHRLLVAFALQRTGLPSTICQAHASPEKAEWIKATDARI